MKKFSSFLILFIAFIASSFSQSRPMSVTCRNNDCGSFTVQQRQGSVNANRTFYDVTNKTSRTLDIKIFVETKGGKWKLQAYESNFTGGKKITTDSFDATGNYVIAYIDAGDKAFRFPSVEEIQKKYGDPGMYHSQYNQ
jgi:hypothetical protein